MLVILANCHRLQIVLKNGNITIPSTRYVVASANEKKKIKINLNTSLRLGKKHQTAILWLKIDSQLAFVSKMC